MHPDRKLVSGVGLFSAEAVRSSQKNLLLSHLKKYYVTLLSFDKCPDMYIRTAVSLAPKCMLGYLPKVSS